MTRRSRQSGFTLIEILVVVMILGLLISLAVPQFLGRTDEARVVKAKADMKAVEAALSLYKLDSGIYPGRLGRRIPLRQRRQDLCTAQPRCRRQRRRRGL